MANYEIYNATWIGAGAGSSGNRSMIIREYAAPKFYNSIFTDFGGKAISIDDKSAAHLNSGLLDIRDNIFWGFATPLLETAAAEILFTDAARNNLNINPMLRGISRAQDGGLDPRPQTGSPAETSTRTAPNDGFYTPVAYKGAFNQVNWARWTWLAQSGILTMDTAAPDPVQPDVAAQISGNQLAISFASEAGVNYQVQTSNNLETWNGGQSQQGTGESMTFNVAMDQPWQFVRVKAE